MKYITIIVLVFLCKYCYTQNYRQFDGTWALSAINGADDSTLVIVYRKDFNDKQFFSNHAINYVWDLRDTSKLKYKTEFSKMQLSDEMTLGYLEAQNNLFYQFSEAPFFKENYATDSSYTIERKQFAEPFAAVPLKESTYRLSGDSLFIINPTQGNSLLAGYYIYKFKAGYLLLEDNMGTTWYFKNVSRVPRFSFKPKLTE